MVPPGDFVYGVQGLLFSRRQVFMQCLPSPAQAGIWGRQESWSSLLLVVQADDAFVSRGATVLPLLRLCPHGTLCVSFDLLLAWGKV